MMDPVDAMLAIMESAFSPRYGEAWNRQQLSRSLCFPSTHFQLIGRDGEEPDTPSEAVGFTLVRAAPGEEELLLIGVKPQFSGRGLGRTLLTRAEDAARARQAEKMFLEMREGNPAERLYLAQGFQPIGRRKDYYTLKDGAKLDAITFGKSL